MPPEVNTTRGRERLDDRGLLVRYDRDAFERDPQRMQVASKPRGVAVAHEAVEDLVADHDDRCSQGSAHRSVRS
jgi:hypothetical protein